MTVPFTNGSDKKNEKKDICLWRATIPFHYEGQSTQALLSARLRVPRAFKVSERWSASRRKKMGFIFSERVVLLFALTLRRTPLQPQREKIILPMQHNCV